MKPGLLIILALLPAAWGVLQDIANTGRGGSIDLRNRVTGARIAAADKDPYSYKWMREDPETFCDLYNEPGGLLSKTTVTPWVLATHAPFNGLNYRTTQWLWFFLQYGVLIAGVYAWLRSQADSAGKYGIALVLLYCVTPAWRHHVDHGQIYVVYVALFLFLYAVSQAKPTRAVSIVGGILGAFTMGGRPVFFEQFAEPVRNRRWWSLGATGFGFLVVFVVPVLLFGPRIWNDYRLAMEAHSEIYLLQLKPTRVPNFTYPGTIEGIPIDTISGFARIPFADTSVYKMLSFQIPPRLVLITWALFAGASLCYMIWKKAPGTLLWWAGAAWILVGDFLLPAFRHTYNDILVIPLILFGISALQGRRELKYWLGTSAAVLILMIAAWKIHGWYLVFPSLVLWFSAAVAAVWALLLAKGGKC
ncbi:MAG: glycosyltransferase 87 family protein [Verrucomicrobiales bacterium]|nr:glycosyltransferase 87 family protein [Verrucomicrobiales bacterium]